MLRGDVQAPLPAEKRNGLSRQRGASFAAYSVWIIYHAFLKEQPDLNWRNPDVKRAMWDAIRFWLDLGVDGFRLDAIATIFEHPGLSNHTAALSPADFFLATLGEKTDADRQRLHEEYQQLMCFQIQQPGLHELMQELRSLVETYPGDCILIGEDEDVAFLGTCNDELHLLFNFPLMRVER